MTLIELLITMALAALLVLGLVQIASGASASTRLQRNQAHIQENARLAVSTIAALIREAGFSPQPWNEQYPSLGLAEISLDAVSSTSDRLALRSWSDLNCFNNRNPEQDAAGNPMFYLRESVFDLNGSRGLTRLCRYGPALDKLSTQIRREGFIQDVDAFQVQYGADPDRDGSIDSWVNAGQWGDSRDVLGVRVGLLLSSRDSVTDAESKTFHVLDSTVRKRADGKLRRVVQFSAAIKHRSG